jgi:lipopolysaccharide transport system ATP-binding protein
LIAKDSKSDLVLKEFPDSTDNSRQDLDLKISYILFRDFQNEIIDSPVTGEPTRLCIGVESRRAINNAIIDLMFQERLGEGEATLRLSNADDNYKINLLAGKYEICLQMPHCGLKPSIYSLKMSVSEGSQYYILDAVEAFNFKVDSKNFNQSQYYQPREWKVIDQKS